MSVFTLHPVAVGETDAERDTYQAGIADAHDEHAAGATPDILNTRLSWMAEYLPAASDAFAAYTLGYSAAVLSLRLNTTRPDHQEAATA